MKIDWNSIAGMAGARSKAEAGKASKAPNRAADMDKIEFSAPRKLDAASFEAALKNEILCDVRKGLGEEELADLRRQIATGQYDVNAADIARRILCDFD